MADKNKLDWLRRHQSQLGAELYNGLADAIVADDVDTTTLGRRFVLPSSYSSGARNMQQQFQDSMFIVRHYGKPTLFITFTAKPNWPEIQSELMPEQTAVDRPDIVS